MKRIRVFLSLILMIYILAGGIALAADTLCAPVTGNEHNMVVFGKVVLEGADFASGVYALYSFGPGGESDCRSKSEIKDAGAFYATIVGSAAGEKIMFTVVDGKGSVFQLRDSIVFQPDATKENLQIQ